MPSSFFKQLTRFFGSRTRDVVTRIAPSPTGTLHIGTARSALFNYLFARQNNGRFIVRIEDTDKARSTHEFERDILDNLDWLGLEHDALFRQSERTDRYVHYLERLIHIGRAYRSREESKTAPGAHVEVVRLRNPGKTVIFDDLVRGRLSSNTADAGDFVIARSMNEPLYHLAAVIDDYEMNVSHVIRGEDHISNTPRHILIQEALGFPRPHYAHIPLILAPDRSKLSKRAGATSISEYRERGYMPEALVNYLALLGWNPGTDQERFVLDELIRAFDIEKVQKGGAIFTAEKLDWFNRLYIKKLSDDALLERVEESLPESVKQLPGYDRAILRRALPIIREHITTFSDITELAAEGEFSYYFAHPRYEASALLWKQSDEETALRHLRYILETLERVPEARFSEESLRAHIWSYASEQGRGHVLWPMRYALSGRQKSPDPFTIAAVLGKHETLARIKTAVEKLTAA